MIIIYSHKQNVFGKTESSNAHEEACPLVSVLAAQANKVNLQAATSAYIDGKVAGWRVIAKIYKRFRWMVRNSRMGNCD